MTIKVLGPGCVSCKKLFESAKEAVAEMGNDIDVEYITDIETIVSYGIMGSPALVINEEVISQGRTLSKDEIIKLTKTKEVLTVSEKNGCDCGGNC
jgi:small redox-active disulfide protein 2